MRLALLPSLALLSLCSCALPTVDISARMGTFDVEGDLGLSDTSVTNSLDVENAGLDKDDSVLSGVFDFKWGMPHLTISAQSSSHGGDGVLDAAIDQDGIIIPAGSSVASDLDLGLYNGVLTFDVIPGSNFELGLGFGVALVDIDASFTATDPGPLFGQEISTDDTVPLPLLALRAGAEWGSFEVGGLFSGISGNIDEFDGSFYDLDAFGRWRFLGGEDRLRGSLLLGWRQLDFDIDYEDGGEHVEADMTFSGPYLGLQLSF